MIHYYYSITGENVMGPISEAQLFYMLGRGEIPVTTQVCVEGEQEWRPLPIPEEVRNTPQLAASDTHQTKSTAATIREEPDLVIPKDKTRIVQGGVIGTLGLFLVIAGVVLCFTLIGGILGVPMVLIGVMIMAWAPALAFGKPEKKTKIIYGGDCPYCGHSNTFAGPSDGHDCPACRRRFVVRDLRFWQVPS